MLNDLAKVILEARQAATGEGTLFLGVAGFSRWLEIAEVIESFDDEPCIKVKLAGETETTVIARAHISAAQWSPRQTITIPAEFALD